MADFYTNTNEELLIDRVRKEGFGFKQPEFSDNEFPKYLVLRVALARALNCPKIPLNSPLWEQKQIKSEKGKKGEYHLSQLTGKASKEKKDDFDLAVRALLYLLRKEEFEGEDLFKNDEFYLQILSKYIKRGLFELQNSWKNSDSIYQWCLESLDFDEVASGGFLQPQNAQDSDFFEQLRRYFKAVGISVSSLGELDSYRHHICQIELENAEQISLFEQKAKYLSNEFGQSVLCKKHEGVSRAYDVQISKPASSWHWVVKKQFQAGLRAVKNGGFKLGIYAGQSVDDKAFCFDLTHAPHLFVAGSTNSGKSVFIKNTIACLLQNKNTEIYLIEVTKSGLDFRVFGSKIHIISQLDAAAAALEGFVREVEDRYLLMRSKNCDDAASLGLNYKVIIIDELKDLIDQEGKEKAVSKPLERLAQMARGAGIHLILSTQKLDGHSFRGTLRTNVAGRVAFKVPKASDSKLILDEQGAQELLGKGDMLVKVGTMSEAKHILGAYLTPEELASVI